MLFCKIKTFIILLLGSVLLISCSEESTSPEVEDLSSTLKKIHNNSNIPGFSYAVIKNGEVVKNESVGFSNVKDGIQYSSQTRQSVASVSKAVLGLAITKAIELNYFELQTEINEILPFNVVNPNYPNIPIKIEHLVTHTASLVDDIEFFFSTYQILQGENISSETAQFMINDLNMRLEEFPNLGEILYAYFSADGEYYDESHFSNQSPGSAYSYSNLASSLAAYLIEIKSGIPYKDFVKNNIFITLGMNNTSFSYSENINSDLYAELYFNKEYEYPKYLSASYPSGSVITTSEDLSKFLIEIIKGYSGQNSSILSKQSYSLMFNKLFTDQYTNASHGIFWFLEGNSVFHAGTDLGSVAKVQFNKETKNGFVFMTNTEIQFSDEAGKNLDDVNKILYALINEIN